MKGSWKITLGVCALAVALTTGSVVASWRYAGSPADEVNMVMNIEMNTFTFWEGAEILPNEEGESHITLIDNLLNGKDSSGNDVGINNPDSAISENIENRLNGGLWGMFNRNDYYGSMDGSILDNQVDMEGLFNTDTLGLSFIIQVIDDLTYYIFTTSVDMGSSGAPNIALGEEIYPVYRSVATRPNASADFTIVSTDVGHATSRYYEQLSGWGILHDQRVPSFDVDSWKSCKEVPIGTTRENAVWTFVGDENSASAEDAVSVVYYRLQGVGERTITSSNMQAEMTVTDSTGTVVATSALKTVDDSLKSIVTFTAVENETYYIAFTGSNYIPFIVSE